MTAYFSLIETDMIRQGVDADPHVLALLSAMPKFILKRIQPQTAAAAIAHGLERRRRSEPPRPLAIRCGASRSGGPDCRRQTRARYRCAASPSRTREPLVVETVLMPSTRGAYPQVVSRAFASFRIARFSVSSAQRDF
jgi:hypothetical protein